jgi:hypothetical protein
MEFLRAMRFVGNQSAIVPPANVLLWTAYPDGADELSRTLPETIHPLDPAAPASVYLVNPNAYQMAFQSGHEVFHLLFSAGNVLHWTHEVGAQTLMSTYLDHRAAGNADFVRYRNEVLADARSQAVGCSTREMMAFMPPYSTAFYGRALIFGREILKTVGSPTYLSIGSIQGSEGPDFWRWVDTLPRRQQRRIRAFCDNETNA